MMNWLRNNKGFLLFLGLFALFRTAVADWNPIPSGSMHPNLLEGDVVLVNRLAFDLKAPLTDYVIAHLGTPQRGDIVTFSSPKDGTRLIKRIVAIPGDQIAMRDKKLTINGEWATYQPEALEASRGTLDAPWSPQAERETVAGNQRQIQWLPGSSSLTEFPSLTIPADQYWVMGDNRDNSADSRYIGLVPRELLIGRATRVLLSIDYKGSWLPRLERFGKALL